MLTDNNSQVNTFIKGLNTDASYSVIQEGQYTDANNIRIMPLSQGEADKTNSYGEVRPIEGVFVVDQIDDDSFIKVLATGYIRNVGVIIYQCSKLVHTSPHNVQMRFGWKVYVYNMSSGEGHINFDSGLLSDSPDPDKFSITLRYEDEDNIKLYIADGIHSIMVLNIAEDNINLNISQIQSYPAIKFTKPVFCGFIEGKLKPALVQYSYRLYNKNGVSTDVSPTTRLIPIIGASNISKRDDLLAFNAGKDIYGLSENETSNVGIKLKFKIDEQYDYLDHILVYRITYVQNGQLPTVELISDREIKVDENNMMEFYDTGQQSLQMITLEEYNSMSGIHIIPKVIESKNDYLFAANIKDELSTFDIGDWDPSENVQWSFVKLQDGIQTDTADIDDSSDNLIKSNKIEFGTSIKEQKILSPDNSYFEDYYGTGTYADPQMMYYFRSLRRDETYRYGIIFYNHNGLSSPVKWIADINTSDIEGDEVFSFNNEKGLVVYPLGVEFTITNIPEDAVSYEIVRCNRNIEDIKNIVQGVVSVPIRRHTKKETEASSENAPDYIDYTYPYNPTGFLQLCHFRVGDSDVDNDDVITAYDDKQNIMQFVCPEVCYQKDYIDILFKHRNLKLFPVEYVYSSAGPTTTLNYTYIIPPAQIISSQNTYLKPAISNTNLMRDGDSYGINLHTIQMPMAFYKISPNTEQFGYGYKDPVNATDINTGDHTGFEVSDWPTIKRFSYSYLKLYLKDDAKYFDPENVDDRFEVTDYKIPQTIQWNQVYQSSVVDEKTTYQKKYEDYVTSVQSGMFCNIIIGGTYGVDVKNAINKDNITNMLNVGHTNHITGLGGPCIVISTKGEPFKGIDFSSNEDLNSILGTYICNLQQNVVPYGGDSDEAKSLNTYYSYGDFFEINRENNSQVCTIYDGDCFILPFEYISMHKYYTPLDKGTGASHMIAYSIPLETNLNLAYTSGNEFSRHYKDVGITNLQVEPAAVYNAYSQKDPLYVYNSAYSSQDKTRVFAAESEYQQDVLNMNTDYRCYHSLLKTNDERVDSWTKFMPADYIDVDTRYGEITNLRTFHNKLVFWQKDATGLLSVNERAAVSDDHNLPLILGTGGILDRYDYIDETAGMMPEQYVDTYSNTTLYWYDAAHREIKSYVDGSAVMQLSKAKSVQNKLNHSTNTHPYIMFDNKYNTVIADVLNGKNILYDETLQQFISTTDVCIDGCMKNNNDIYVVKNNKIALLDTPVNNDDIIYCGWDGNILSTYIQYVVNKSPLTTKVFDNQEIVTVNNPVNYDLELIHDDESSYFSQHHVYTWTTDLNTTSSDDLEMTLREGNYRYSIPRCDGQEYGNRLRGKYMICSIEDLNPHKDSSLSYVITKFRTSWS